MSSWDCPGVRALIEREAILDRMVAANARPLGGVERVAARNAWRGKLEANGYTRPECGPEGGSTTPPPPEDWTKERLAVLRDRLFPDQAAFSKFLGNLRRWIGAHPSPEQTREALEAQHMGKSWRDILPQGDHKRGEEVRTVGGLRVVRVKV